MAKKPTFSQIKVTCKKALGACSSFLTSLLPSLRGVLQSPLYRSNVVRTTGNSSRLLSNNKNTSLRLMKQSLSSFFDMAIFRALTFVINKLRLVRLELGYKLHLGTRTIHDTLVIKVPVYKKTTESKYAIPVKKATVSAFFLSLVLFTALQYVLPLLNPFKPTATRAGSNTRTWTNNGDFYYNKATNCSQTSHDANVNISGTGYGDTTCATAATDSSLSLANPVMDLDTIALAVGSHHTLAIKTDGTLWAWGDNSGYQLGDNTNVNRTTPTQISSATDWKMVSASYKNSAAFSFALKNNGELYAWGENNDYNLGLGDNIVRKVPTRVGAHLYKHVALTYGGTLLVRNDGTLWTVGANYWGELGIGTPTSANALTQVGSDTDWKFVSASMVHTFGIKNNGSLYAWGNNGYGALGTGNTTTYRTPQRVGTDTNWKMVTASNGSLSPGQHTIGLKTDGTLWSWGNNDAGGLGTGTADSNNHSTPVRVGSESTWIQAVAGRISSYGLKADGTLWSWGRNPYGQLGQGNTNDYYLPTRVGVDTDWKFIAVPSFDYNLIAVKNNGLLYGSGGNSQANLGLGDATQRNSITQIGTGWRGVLQLYPSPGIISGIKVDAGLGIKYRWSTLGWNTVQIPTNASVNFKYRTSDDGVSWSDPTWTQSGTTFNSGTTGSVSLSGLTPTRYLELKITLSTSDGLNTPILNDFRVDYDSLEAPINTNTTIYKTDGTTKLKDITGADVNAGQSPTGGAWTNESSVKIVTSGLTCTGCGNFTSPYIEVEAKPVGTAFDGTAGITVGAVDGSNVSTATLTNLTVGTGYHLQMRTKDAQGRVSGWTSYGTNAESAADVTADQGVPTGTVSINSAAQYAASSSVTLTNNTTDTGGSGLGQMHFSNDGMTWSGWEPYSATKAWTLSSGDGSKKVYAQYKDNAGNNDADVTSVTWDSKADFEGTTQGVTTTLAGNLNLTSSPGTVRLTEQGSQSFSYKYGLNGDAGKTATGEYSLAVPDGVTSFSVAISGAGGGGNDGSLIGGQGGDTYVVRQDDNAFKMTATGGSGSGITGAGSTGSFSGPTTFAGQGNAGGAGGYTGTPSGYVYSGTCYWPYDGYYYSTTLEDCLAVGDQPQYDWVEGSGSQAAGGGSGGKVTGSVANEQVSGKNLTVNIGTGGIGKNDNDNTVGVNGSIGTVTISYTYSLSGPQSGTLGVSGVGLRAGSETGKQYSWSTIHWVGSGLNTNNKIGIRVKIADAFGLGSFVNPVDGTSGYHYIDSGTYGDIPILVSSKAKIIEIQLTLVSDGNGMPILDSLSTEGNTDALSDEITLDSQAPTGTVSINTGNPANTSSKAVTLFLDPTDVAPSSGMKDFQLSNDGVTWGTATDANGGVTDSGTWKTWDANAQSNYTTGSGHSGYAWNLSTGDGTKKVYVKFRDNAGNVGGTTAPANYLVGRTGSALAGKYVYNRDISATDKYTNGNTIGTANPKWKTSDTACIGPQCTTVGPVAETQAGYAGLNVLVADNSVDFALSTSPPTYPARDACKALGGRLPTIAELVEMYFYKSNYGNNFQGSQYWSSTEGSIILASTVFFDAIYEGYVGDIMASNNKTFANNTNSRCVKDNPILTISDSILLDTVPPPAVTTTNATTPTKNAPALYWTGVTDTGSGTASYNIYRSNTGGVLSAKIGSTTVPTVTYTDNSLSADGTYYYTVQAVDNMNQEQTVGNNQKSVVYDTNAPATTVSTLPTPNDGGSGYFKTNPAISLTQVDPAPASGNGVTVYRWDNGDLSTGTTTYTGATFNIPAQGTHTLYWRSTDLASNVEVTKNQVFKLDTIAPATTLSTSPGTNDGTNGWFKTNPDITLSETDATSGAGPTVYRWDNSDLSTGTTPYTGSSFKIISNGLHTLYWRSTDNAGVVEANQSQTLKLDSAVPAGTVSINEGLSTQSHTVHLTLNATDTGTSNLASYELKNADDSGASWLSTAIIGSPSSFSDTYKTWDLSPGEGTKTVSVRYYDNAGNISNTGSINIYNDTTPPTDVSGVHMYENSSKSHDITTGNTTLWYPYTTTYFEWSASTAGSGINTYKYCFSTDANCTPTTPTTSNATNFTTSLGSSFDNSYYLRVVAVSNVLLESTPVTFQYNFDKSAPAAITGFDKDTPASPDTQIKLKWNAVPTNNGAPLLNYKLERVEATVYPGLSGSWSGLAGYAVYTTTSLTFTDDATTPQQGQPLISPSTRYVYRISARDQSNASYGSFQDAPLFALTRDVAAPEFPPLVGTSDGATACDGTTGTCAATDPSDTSVNQKGFSTKVTWTAGLDIGSGISHYKIYRTTNESDADSWQVVGVTYSPILGPLPQGSTVTWYDNDTHNDATYGTDKTVATTRLNDSTVYYYRITAVDAATPGNETSLIPSITDGPNFVSADQNFARTRPGTPDVTAPTSPTSVVANAQGLDHTNEHQLISISWGAGLDYKRRSSDVVPGIITYNVYRSTSPAGPWDNRVKITTNLSFDDEGLAATTTYYYRVTAYDAIPNESPLSSLLGSSSAQTYSSEVPSVPANINVTMTTGNPNTDTTVGHSATISFTGSSSNAYQITKYEVYRSTSNTSGSCNPGERNANCWLRVNAATKISTVDITPTPDDRLRPHTVTDSGLADATMYFYRVWAQDNTSVPGRPEQSNLYSGLTGIAPDTLHVGWDITPDATAPALPAEVKVKDIHDDGMNYRRNIVTWARIAIPLRNGVNDFKEYKVYRSTDSGTTWEQICKNGTNTILLPACTVQYPNPLYNADKELSLANNYFMDLIPRTESESNKFFYYHVTASDDSGNDYKYANGTVINPNNYNESKSARNGDGTIAAVSLNPFIAKPSICDVGSSQCVITDGAVKASMVDIGVASATISWKTDQPADTIVEFKRHDSNDAYTGVVNRDMVINHQIVAKPLEPSTLYDYRIISRNSLANEVTAEGASVPALQTTGFTISAGTTITTTSTAEVNWTTNLDASSSFVEYQLQKQPGDDPQGGTAGVEPAALASSPRTHKVIVKGLRSSRTYTYKIKSISKDGYLSEYPGGEFATFKTKSFDSAQFTLAPASSNVAERNITATTAQIVWQTESPTTSWVDYSTTPGVYDGASGNNDLVGTHVIVIEGLIPGTKYYYRVRVKDANEVEYTSQEYSFTAVLKPKISNMTVKDVTPYSVTVAWDTNVDTETIINWGKTTAYGEKRGKSGVSKVHELVIDKLDDNQEYHYQILAKDDAGNEVADTDKIVRTPLDTEGPKITGVKIDVLPMGESDNTSSVIVSWQTNKPATTLVEYDEGVIGGSYGKSSVEDTTLNNSHTVIIKGLTPASSYHYRLVSADKRLNKTISQDYTFVTPSKEKSILQLILKSLEETFAWTKNLNQFFGNVGKRITGR